VRRFNHVAFACDEHCANDGRDPDVSVRARGVTEKRTFCPQRIAQARMVTNRENRYVGAQEVRTTCQAPCPPQTISFGNVAAADAEVAARRRRPLARTVLPSPRTLPPSIIGAINIL
jgi:molybdopterin-containing oxidoreductase family iron-sulfur binding subunit